MQVRRLAKWWLTLAMVAVPLLALTGVSHAAFLSFEGPIVSSGQQMYWLASGAESERYVYRESSFTLDPNRGALQRNGPTAVLPNAADSGSIEMNAIPFVYDTGRPGSTISPILLGRDEGLAFSLLSIDLSEYSVSFPVPTTITLTGIKTTGGSIQMSFLTDGIIDGRGGVADFEHFVFGPDWRDLVRAEFTSDGLFGMDNIEYRLPEPTAETLAGLGLLMAAYVRLTRRSPAQAVRKRREIGSV